MMVPSAGLSDQLTAGLLAPVTAASKATEAPAPTDTELGPTVTAIGCNDTMAVADFVESAALVAVTVMVCWLAITGGA
jgi:hypothetical protein